MSAINKTMKTIIFTGVILVVMGIILSNFPLKNSHNSADKTKNNNEEQEKIICNGIEYTNINIIKKGTKTRFKLITKNTRPADSQKQAIKIVFITGKNEIVWETEIIIPELKTGEKKEVEYDYLGEIPTGNYKIEITRSMPYIASD